MPVTPDTINKGITVGKSIFNIGKSIFGSGQSLWQKYGETEAKFNARFTDAPAFRKIWINGYFANEGASEIPIGLTTEDFHEQLFGGRVSPERRHLYPTGLGRGTVAGVNTVSNVTSDVLNSNNNQLLKAGLNIKNVSVGILAIGVLALLARKF